MLATTAVGIGPRQCRRSARHPFSDRCSDVEYCPSYPTTPLQPGRGPCVGRALSLVHHDSSTVASAHDPGLAPCRHGHRDYTAEIVSIMPPNAPIPRGGQAPPQLDEDRTLHVEEAKRGARFCAGEQSDGERAHVPAILNVQVEGRRIETGRVNPVTRVGRQR